MKLYIIVSAIEFKILGINQYLDFPVPGLPIKVQFRFRLVTFETIIVTDPKEEILKATGMSLKKKGYDIRVLNIKDKWFITI